MRYSILITAFVLSFFAGIASVAASEQEVTFHVQAGARIQLLGGQSTQADRGLVRAAERSPAVVMTVPVVPPKKPGPFPKE